MKSMTSRILGSGAVALGLLAPIVAAAQNTPAAATSPAAKAPRAAASKGSKSSFGGSSSITGVLAMVRPEYSLVVLARMGPGEPSTPTASWTQTVARGTREVIDKTPLTLASGPGETDYAFKVTGSTAIKVNGRKASLKDLAAVVNQHATVRFTAARSGDYALSIEVAQP